MERRILGETDLKEETSNENNRISIKDGNEIGKNKMVIGEESREGVSESDAPFQ